MTGAAVLAGYALATGALVPCVLRRGWAARAPRFAIGLWLTLVASWVAATVLALLLMAAPAMLSWGASNGSPGLSASGVAELLLAAAVFSRAAGCLAGGAARARRERRTHAAFLDAVARPDHALGVVVLDQQAPAAYCLPGRPGRIVVSTATLAALRPAQLAAVLAHEHAHLHARHHLLVAIASAATRAFPLVPLLAGAGPQVAALAEMAADDHATRRHQHGDLAAALVTLATGNTRATVLAAGGPAAITRIERLLAPPVTQPRQAKIVRLASAATALAIPTAVACLPLLLAACAATGQR